MYGCCCKTPFCNNYILNPEMDPKRYYSLITTTTTTTATTTNKTTQAATTTTAHHGHQSYSHAIASEAQLKTPESTPSTSTVRKGIITTTTQDIDSDEESGTDAEGSFTENNAPDGTEETKLTRENQTNITKEWPKCEESAMEGEEVDDEWLPIWLAWLVFSVVLLFLLFALLFVSFQCLLTEWEERRHKNKMKELEKVVDRVKSKAKKRMREHLKKKMEKERKRDEESETAIVLQMNALPMGTDDVEEEECLRIMLEEEYTLDDNNTPHTPLGEQGDGQGLTAPEWKMGREQKKM
ncbi:MAG: hypothetical protein GY737_08270 [Desulfobacteraceae bacterium]|nr:hypothetical protein [Desulfobacteraceae bacterium]